MPRYSTVLPLDSPFFVLLASLHLPWQMVQTRIKNNTLRVSQMQNPVVKKLDSEITRTI